MPVIEVSLLPQDMKQAELEALYEKLWDAIERIPALGLTRTRPQDVTFLFPTDLMKYGTGDYILVRVTELEPKPERTKEVREAFAEELADTLGLEALTSVKFVEVIIKEASPDDVVRRYVAQSTVQPSACPDCYNSHHMRTGTCASCGRTNT